MNEVSASFLYPPPLHIPKSIGGLFFLLGRRRGDEERDESVDGFSGQGKRVCEDRT